MTSISDYHIYFSLYLLFYSRKIPSEIAPYFSFLVFTFMAIDISFVVSPFSDFKN